MSTEPENLVLQHLRALRNDFAEFKSEMRTALNAIEHRLGRVEIAIGELHTDYAAVSVRIDQLQADMRLLKSRYDTVG